MKRLVLGCLAAWVAAAGAVYTQAQATSFKVGTFDRQGRQFVGVVLKDAFVIDLGAATSGLKQAPATAPRDMKDLIARYDSGVRDLILAAIKTVGDPAAAQKLGYVHDLKSVKILPPIMYPQTMLNAAINYREHAAEMAALSGESTTGLGSAPKDTKSAPGLWDRKPGDTRWNPYVFLKPSSAVTGHNDPVRLPPGRDMIDWECELGAVVGRTATRVPVERARDYIFGYTIQLDVSDRGGRGDSRLGSDWLVGKAHDTFAPLGPFIVPKEFIKDPQNLKVTYTLNGKVMQDANTSLMIHNVYELLAYGSSNLTLQPGDVIATGSPAGVGSARKPPIFFKPGDVSACTYEGVGTLTNPIVGAAAGSTAAR
jgi:2-keto-4-pentenoate hydratase/2-oxohepta-3-ene-1,7-dioic acid hydratase in catechol pathway